MKSNIDVSILISNELKKLREKTGLTTKEFSEIIKKKPQQLYRYEKGVNRIDIDTIIIYLRALDVYPIDFLEEIDQKIGLTKSNELFVNI
ncbi:helix-turn-helix domain-containing protein [Providencia alcalifaciens]|uniref:helix-turn-helix domain-containing protein n=1 Tax=Providencia alcalifaciens TaxID=126385 RepID=UPI00029C7478|nr:helix-turn-helix transcriptional regulator [Providencia alcalifaciens]EKT61799.1 transcriptional regulator [Providencia alcalifaciens Dmel2]